MNSIKSIYVNGLACIKVKGGEGECFRINDDVRQGCIMSPWLFNVYMDAVIKAVKLGMGRRGQIILEWFGYGHKERMFEVRGKGRPKRK